MSETVPGLFISKYVDPSHAYVMDLSMFLLTHGEGTRRGLAIHPDAWGRLTPAQQEKVMDTLVRRSADDGLRALERFLA